MILRDGDGDGALEVTAGEVEPPTSMRPGDVRTTVRVSARDFSGRNDAVWFAADEFAGFLAALRLVERDRRGQAELRSMNPEDLGLNIRVRDRAGHVTASGWLGRIWYAPSGELVAARVGFNLDVDPTLLPGIVAELTSLGAVG